MNYTSIVEYGMIVYEMRHDNKIILYFTILIYEVVVYFLNTLIYC